MDGALFLNEYRCWTRSHGRSQSSGRLRYDGHDRRACSLLLVTRAAVLFRLTFPLTHLIWHGTLPS